VHQVCGTSDLEIGSGYVARILFWRLIAEESADRLQLVTGIDLDRSVIGESEIGKAAARRSALDAPSSTAAGARGPRTLAKSPRPSGDGHRPRGARSWPRARRRSSTTPSSASCSGAAAHPRRFEATPRTKRGAPDARSTPRQRVDTRRLRSAERERSRFKNAAVLRAWGLACKSSRAAALTGSAARHHRRLPGVSPADSTFVIALLTAGAVVSSRSSSAPSAASPNTSP
jgi:hypothetical protein